MIKNVPRYNENPNCCGMVMDDLGRWVRFEDHNRECLRLEAVINELSAMLSQRNGRSSVYWQEVARRAQEARNGASTARRPS